MKLRKPVPMWLFLKSGKLITAGSIASVLNKDGEFFVAAEDMKPLEQALNDINAVQNIHFKNSRYYLTLGAGMTSSQLNQTLFERGIVVSELGHERANLEANFLELVK